MGFTYLQIWGFDFDRAIESTKEIKSIIEHLEIASLLQPRDAFFGGRTEALKLHAQADEDTVIKYVDVTSLYPFINKTGKFPLGRPQIVTENNDQLQNYEGLIKCRILPQIQTCQHTNRDRMITRTWVTDESEKKLFENGYVIDKIFKV